MEKTGKQARVLARILAEEELKSVQGADTVVVTTPPGRRDITDSNNGDIAE
ncbi:MAG TPA: hypothetical protein VMM92_00245 [Thermoanaerobaculia bacterium]|nr:hypothetical protein [Thermoanaerobaculia bacterium]